MDKPRGTKFCDYQINLMNLLSQQELEKFKPKMNRLELIKLANELENKYTIEQNQISEDATLNNKLIKLCPINNNIENKNLKIALVLKDKGNEAFSKGNWTQALEFYNQSYLCTPALDVCQVQVILSNRTAALYHCGKYEMCLKEIDEILSSTADINHLRHKLTERKARCHLALDERKQALEAFRSTLRLLDDSTLPLERRQKLQTDVQVMIKLLNKSLEKGDNKKKLNKKKVSEEGNKFIEENIKNKSKSHPSASDAVSIVQDEKGRHAVATRDIRTGELILQENAHAHVLLSEYHLIRCLHCFQATMTPIACPSCSGVIFCSKNCFEAAIGSESHEGYHAVECASMKSLIEAGFSLTCLLSLRILAQRPVEYFLELEQVLNKIDRGKGLQDDGTKDPSSYLSVYHLVTHSRLRTSKDLAYRAFTSLYLARCLDLGGYFKNIDDKQQVMLYCASLILHNLQFCQFNAHEISELVTSNAEPKANSDLPDHVSNKMIGGAVYPTLALFNHSCDPALVRCHKGTRAFVKTIRPIRAGEEIPENYGPIYTQQPKEKRIDEMKSQYWFDCSCRACEEDWPLLEDMAPDTLRLRCKSKKKCTNVIPITTNCEEFMIKCRKCKEYTNIMNALAGLQGTNALFKEAYNLLYEGKFQEALKKYIGILELLHSSLVPPFKDYNLAQQGIKTCMMFYGNIAKDNQK